ncbi:class I SAM-dependent methyltransferase [Anaerobacillus sp. MEB173]|uniref:class I SAM-dependent methyltransferase n=1 Tax=Anaerobacillus sp. MEB173 TaxID=3383345 RepID=UPI003F90A245
MTGEEFDSLVQFFDGMARTSWLSRIHDQLKELTGSWNGLIVLDVGCGTGRILLRGAKEAEHVTGIDLSPEMIKAAKENFILNQCEQKGDFIVGDACQLPFDDFTYDISISTCVLFLLPEPELGINEMLRVTKRGGKLVMLNPSITMSQEEAATYCKTHGITDFEQKTLLQWANVSTRRHRYDQDSLTEYLKQNGATNVTNQEVLDGLAIITVATL